MKRLTAKQYALALTEVLSDASAKQRPVIAKKFFALLQRRHQTRLLPRILDQVEAELQRQQGIVPAQLEAAAATPASLQKTLEKRLDTPVALTTTINPSLVAGARLTVGETLYDGSLRGLLAALRHQLITPS